MSTWSRDAAREAIANEVAKLPLDANDPDETLEGHASLARVDLQEEIEADDRGLPDDCRPGTLTWLDG